MLTVHFFGSCCDVRSANILIVLVMGFKSFELVSPTGLRAETLLLEVQSTRLAVSRPDAERVESWQARGNDRRLLEGVPETKLQCPLQGEEIPLQLSFAVLSCTRIAGTPGSSYHFVGQVLSVQSFEKPCRVNRIIGLPGQSLTLSHAVPDRRKISPTPCRYEATSFKKACLVVIMRLSSRTLGSSTGNVWEA
jgi:hypothetical protein